MFEGNTLGASIRPIRACNIILIGRVLVTRHLRFYKRFECVSFSDTPVRYILPLCTITFRMDTTLIPTESQISLHLLYQHDSIGLTLRRSTTCRWQTDSRQLGWFACRDEKDDPIELHDCAPAILSGWLVFCVGVTIQTLISIRICGWSGYSSEFTENGKLLVIGN